MPEINTMLEFEYLAGVTPSICFRQGAVSAFRNPSRVNCSLALTSLHNEIAHQARENLITEMMRKHRSRQMHCSFHISLSARHGSRRILSYCKFRADWNFRGLGQEHQRRCRYHGAALVRQGNP